MSNTSEILIVIPARFASQRFPGKPLKQLTNRLGIAKPLIEWTWDAAVRAVGADAVVVATDDDTITDVVQSFGGHVVMTSTRPKNGTERCAEVLAHLGKPPKLLVNLQGDSPLVPASHITDVIACWRSTQAQVVTAYAACTQEMSKRIVEEYRADMVGATTVVTRTNGEALYFSKTPIPAQRDPILRLKMHLGLYAYTPAALQAYAKAGPSTLEQSEGLEQLRFLELGITVQTVAVDMPATGMWEVNNPSDVSVVEAALPV
jgi:3-deoxy-manno-octulosonate cytidylyltransferase (CMP-KDO synthetase)